MHKYPIFFEIRSPQCMVASQSNITCCPLAWYFSLVQCVTVACHWKPSA